MEKFLIDTNALWEIICEIAGFPVRGKCFDIERIKRGECYISEVTRVEIMSVMGKYARGEQAQWQICNRITGDDGTRCSQRHYNPGRKKWKRKQIAPFRKLIDDIVNGRSSVFKVAVLPITHEVVSEAERFIDLAFKYKFASMDAMIAATAKCYGTDEICVVTHDGSLRRALVESGIHIMDEITREQMDLCQTV